MKATIQTLSQRFVQVYYTLYSLRLVQSKREFCLAIGMQPQNFHPIETERLTVSLPIVCNTINAYGVSPDWLFLGEGNMLRSYGDSTI